VPLAVELIALRDRRHTKDHPFFDLWAEGRLSLEQMGRYMAQHYHLVQNILRPFGIAFAKAPPDVQGFLIENLAEEYGLVGEGSGAPKNHNAILLRWTQACGLAVDAVVRETEPLPELRALLDLMWRLVYNEPWQVWLATQAAMESQMVGVQSRTVPALQKHYGFPAGDARVEWFEEHLVADVEHGEKAFELVERHVSDSSMAARCKEAVREALDARWYYVDAVYRAYVE